MRNRRAVDAWLRGGAGPMKDRRAPRGGARNWRDEYLEEGAVRDLCRWCLQEIDPEVCECGDPIDGRIHSGHTEVPMGCRCLYQEERD